MSFDEVRNEFHLTGRLSSTAVRELTRFIAGDEGAYDAIALAGDAGARETAPAIAGQVDNPDPMVRWIALGVLCTRFRSPEMAEPCLRVAVSDSDDTVRNQAVVGVGELLPLLCVGKLRTRSAEFLLEALMGPKSIPLTRVAAHAAIEAAMEVPVPERRPIEAEIDLGSEKVISLSGAFRDRYL